MEEPITLHEAATERAEAEFVAATIENLMGGHDLLTANREHTKEQFGKTGRALGFGDFAVLYRTDVQSAALREAFDRAGIPYKKSSPAPIADHGLVRSLLAALDRQAAEMHGVDLPARIAAAAEQLRRDGDADIAALTEARRWLTALAGSVHRAIFVQRSTNSAMRAVCASVSISIIGICSWPRIGLEYTVTAHSTCQNQLAETFLGRLILAAAHAGSNLSTQPSTYHSDSWRVAAVRLILRWPITRSIQFRSRYRAVS
jgi:hypothetical protein